MALKMSDLKVSPEFLGDVFYVGLVRMEDKVDGENVKMQRHEVMSQKHGFFHVLTPVNVSGLQEEDKIVIENPCFLHDPMNGRGMAASVNVKATGLRKA